MTMGRMNVRVFGGAPVARRQGATCRFRQLVQIRMSGYIRVLSVVSMIPIELQASCVRRTKVVSVCA